MTDENKKHGPDEAVENNVAAEADVTIEAETPAEPDPVDVLRAENADLRDRYLRPAAEMDNLRRRTERDVKDAKSYSVAGFARDMLAVSDNLRRALDAIPADYPAVRQWWDLIHTIRTSCGVLAFTSYLIATILTSAVSSAA